MNFQNSERATNHSRLSNRRSQSLSSEPQQLPEASALPLHGRNSRRKEVLSEGWLQQLRSLGDAILLPMNFAGVDTV
jgi:hypothetical protein